jgi:hypothetical protein
VAADLRGVADGTSTTEIPEQQRAPLEGRLSQMVDSYGSQNMEGHAVRRGPAHAVMDHH